MLFLLSYFPNQFFIRSFFNIRILSRINNKRYVSTWQEKSSKITVKVLLSQSHFICSLHSFAVFPNSKRYIIFFLKFYYLYFCVINQYLIARTSVLLQSKTQITFRQAKHTSMTPKQGCTVHHNYSKKKRWAETYVKVRLFHILFDYFSLT